MKTLMPPGNTTPKKTQGQTSNFAKALLEAGGNIAQSAVDTGIKMANESITSLFNSTASNIPENNNDTDKSKLNNPMDQMNQPWFKESQEIEWKKREQALLRHREVNQVEVFDRRQVEIERKIEQILTELKALSKDLDHADKEARQASIVAMQNNVNPGEYHVTFLQKFLKVIMLLRKRVKDSISWMQTSNSRRSAQKGYWAQFHSQGTQWSMSGERSIATSVG